MNMEELKQNNDTQKKNPKNTIIEIIHTYF